MIESLLAGENPAKQDAAKPAAQTDEEAAIELAKAEQDGDKTTEDAPQTEDKLYKVKIDGKEVEVPINELVDGFQNKKVSTQRFMEAAEIKKAAEAELNQARTERQQYANQLRTFVGQLDGVLKEQDQLDLDSILERDPVEYMKQRNLYEKRQVARYQIATEHDRVMQQQQAENAKAQGEYLQRENQALLDKLPEWKDEAKAKVEKEALAKYLIEAGKSKDDVQSLANHVDVILFHKAQKYDALIARAKEAAKKVAPLPKVERPGTAESTKPDGRTAAMQRLSKSGRVEDAAAVFADLL